MWFVGADIDDDECANIATALLSNKSVISLSLTNNMIGGKENYNVVYPDSVTGPEALGKVLRVNRTLLHLDLRWNYIRKDSAISLAEAVMANKTLKVLKLGNINIDYITFS